MTFSRLYSTGSKTVAGGHKNALEAKNARQASGSVCCKIKNKSYKKYCKYLPVGLERSWVSVVGVAARVSPLRGGDPAALVCSCSAPLCSWASRSSATSHILPLLLNSTGRSAPQWYMPSLPALWNIYLDLNDKNHLKYSVTVLYKKAGNM